MTITILQGDCLEVLRALPEGSAHCCVTSPPYWGLRDYGVDGQIGREETPEAYVEAMVSVFRSVRRVLRGDGTLWLNLGDSYAGSMKGIGADGHAYAGEKQASNKGSVGIFHERPPSAAVIGLKPKDLAGIPWRVAFALQADGWYLRQDIIWSKPNPMPESVTDRCTKAHEYIFLMTKNPRYFYDSAAIKEPSIYAGKTVSLGEKSLSKGQSKGANVEAHGNALVDSVIVTDTRNKRSVWEVATSPYAEAHFATFPPKLIEPCVLAGCPEGGTVLDPFFGAGTTGLVADRLQRNCTGIEINPEYIEIAAKRIKEEGGMFTDVHRPPTPDETSHAQRA